MKISIDKSILWKPLDQVSKVLSTKNIMPILSEILIEVNENGLSMIGGDGTVFLKSMISPDDFQMIRSGSITIPGKRLVEIVKKLKDVIDISVDGHQITIKSGRSKFEMSGMDAEEYPKMEHELGQIISVSGQTIKELITKTIFAVYTKEDAPILTGLRISLSENGIEATGTDRHRLSKTAEKIEDGFDFTTVVGAGSLNELIKIIPDKEKVNISFYKDRFIVQTESFVFSSRVLEGAYPDVDRMTPTNFQTVVTVKTQEFIEALKGVDIIAKEHKTNLVKMIVEDEIELFAESDQGKANEFAEIIHMDGDRLRISFNAKFALSALEVIESEEITINYNGKHEPIVFKGVGNETDIHLILPYRTEV
ncbi:DNA polymerase III subunit beta [Paenibacillus sp.]|jgi:DNA polymerase-3 subunit beta|uniref:DNA polymerase III subunit beta n=1 Tax=Paenibacillus sp. TaxID=58172 RepID=UPI002826F591|nr:DNA polymerase III subunit beta [Paenibacillus sp.]MDR0269602.1 DNA polymerase III subunit beta [Paenibacillus sp.]